MDIVVNDMEFHSRTNIGDGVMTTPALVVDGKVVSYGKVLKKTEILEILKKERQ